MRKKYLSALLFGALLFASAGTFTSCKDYDDDINNLQSQVDKLATKEEMEAKLSQMQTAIDDAKKTAEDALKAAQEAGSTEEIAKLEARIKALEDAALDVDALKKEISESVDEQMAVFREEMEKLLKEVEELTGYSLTMVTGISFVAADDNNVWQDPNLNLNYARITVSYPENLRPGDKVKRETPTSYEFGKGLTGAFTVTNNEVNTVVDHMLVNLDPVDAVVSNDMISLVNGNGQNLNDYLDMSIEAWSQQIITRGAESTGLRQVSVQLKKTVDFEAFDKLVLPSGAHASNPDNCDGNHNYIAYALAVTDADKSRTVTSSFDVTMHVQQEQIAEKIAENTLVYSGDASIPAEAISKYPKGADAASGDEGCYPVQSATPFNVWVGSATTGGRVMASYIVVDYDNETLSTTDKAALKGMKFSGVDEVTKTLSHSITISGDYAAGVPVPLKLVTIDYTGNVEVNVFWVKVGEPVLMDANFAVTPSKFVSDATAWTPESTMEEFKVPAGTTQFTMLLVAGETAHQDASSFEVTNKTDFAAIANYLTLYKSDKKTTTTAVKDVAYAKFAGKLNLMLMREDKEYEGVIKFYDAKGTYLGSNSISVKKVLPTAIPAGLTAKTNAIHSDGTLTVYAKPGTGVGQYDLSNSFNFSEELKADGHLAFNTPTFKVDDNTYYAKYNGTSRQIVNIVKDVIGSKNTYPTTVTYDYGDIKYHPEGHGVQEPGHHIVTWGTKFNIKFGCLPVDSKYAWTGNAPVVYYKEDTTINPATKYDDKGNATAWGNFLTVSDPYGQGLDPFSDSKPAADWNWGIWSPLLNNDAKVKVELITNGDKVNEFFTADIVDGKNGTQALKLTKTSTSVVLSGDVETTVVFKFTDNFGHEHAIKALTFTMKKDHNK